jgi:phage shock protein A
MGIFGRLSDILSANINDLIDRAEDLQKMMEQMIRKCRNSCAMRKFR